MAVWILDKTDLRTNGVKHGITPYMWYSSWKQELIKKAKGMYIPQNRASEYIKQKLIELQGAFDKYANVVGDFSTLSSVTGRIS